MIARRSPLLDVREIHHDPATIEALDLLRVLSDRQRTVLVLRYFAGLSVRETAEAMGIAEGTVKSLASAGRSAARSELIAAEALA